MPGVAPLARNCTVWLKPAGVVFESYPRPAREGFKDRKAPELPFCVAVSTKSGAGMATVPVLE